MRPRIVLLGASNLTRGVSTVVETARMLVGRPVDFYIALGHGRSLGTHSTVLGRRLPGMLESGLWAALDDDSARPTYALLTDIGNDVMYGAQPGQVAQWAESMLDRLGRMNARTVLTGLPMENILGLGRMKYRIARTILFPGRPMPYDEAMDRVRDLNKRVAALGSRPDVAYVRTRPQWYGIDGIHIRMKRWTDAWGEMLAPWNDENQQSVRVRGSIKRCLHLRLMAPQRRWFFGIERRQTQPAGTLRDGSTIWLY